MKLCKNNSDKLEPLVNFLRWVIPLNKFTKFLALDQGGRKKLSLGVTLPIDNKILVLC